MTSDLLPVSVTAHGADFTVEDPNVVTMQEHRQFHDSVFSVWHSWTARPQLPSTPLWHYTSSSSAISIIQSSKIYSTQVSCMNDFREIRHAQDLLVKAMIARRDSLATAGHERDLLDRCVIGLTNDQRPDSYWFVTSFSSVHDDLSQWRAYGGGEGGVALGLDPSALSQGNLCFPRSVFLAPVCYDADVHDMFAHKVVDETLKHFNRGLERRPGLDKDKWTASFLEAWAIHVGFLGPVIKSRSFRDENEWRLLYQLKDYDFGSLLFRQKGQIISRHLPLPIRWIHPDLLPITHSLVGPSRFGQVSLVSLNTLLRNSGYVGQYQVASELTSSSFYQS